MIKQITTGKTVAMIAGLGQDGIDQERPQIGSDTFATVLMFHDDEGRPQSRVFFQLSGDSDVHTLKALLWGISSMFQVILKTALQLVGRDYKKVWELLEWQERS